MNNILHFLLALLAPGSVGIMMSPVWGKGRGRWIIPTVAVATVAVGGTAITTRIIDSGGGGGESGIANIWVGASGSCDDLTTPGSYNASTSCGSIDAANDTCEGGDIIRVHTGTTIGSSPTGTTNVSGSNSRSTPCVVRGESDGDSIPVTGILNFNSGAGDMTVYNLVWNNQTNTAYDEWADLFVNTTGNDLTFYNADSSTFHGFACASNCNLIGGDIGPCLSDRDPPSCVPKIALENSSVPSNGWTLKNLNIHGQLAVPPAVANCGSDSCHTDGLAIFGGTNILLDGVHFWNNMTTNIRVQNCCGNQPANITIQNSTFGYAVNNTTAWSPNSNAMDWDTAIAGAVFRFNSLYGRPSCPSGGDCGIYATPNGTSGSPMQYIGNIMWNPNCGSNGDINHQNVFFQWNEFASGYQCGATNSAPAWTVSQPYASMPGWGGQTNSGLEPNFHITGGAWVGDNKVTSGCIPLDADGNSRGSTCDAGAYER